jgi:site-specific recombinase XerD
MLLPCPPYWTQQTGLLTRGLTLREIQPNRAKFREHPWLTAFLKALAREDVASVTVRGYHSDLGQFAVWYDGQPIEKLTASDLAHFRQYLSRDRSMKPASVNRKLEALRRFCRWPHTTGKLRTNVAAELKLARAPRGMRPKGLLPAEVQGLLRAAGQSRRALARRNYAVVQLLLQAGLRVSEAAALRIEDLEIRERQGKVRICGKGNKERYVPLNTPARRALQTYLDKREETSTQDPVFLSDTGAALSVRSIQSLISELARRARITRIAVSAHTLRHTFALGYLKQNPGMLVELATLLGHESLDTTAIYLRIARQAPCTPCLNATTGRLGYVWSFWGRYPNSADSLATAEDQAASSCDIKTHSLE